MLSILSGLYSRLYTSIYASKYGLYIFLIIILYPIYPIAYPILLLYVLYRYFSRRQSTFWHRQPIHSDTFGLIKSPDNIVVNDIQLAPDESWTEPNNESLMTFLTQHYERDLQITPAYLDYQHYLIIGIKKVDQLIATIGATMTTFKIGDDVRKGFYVDLLCIDRQYRKGGYAVKMMEKLIEKWKALGSEIMLFKLDNMQIAPWKPNFTFQYYLLDKSTISVPSQSKRYRLEQVNETNLLNAYNYFTSQMKKYDIVEEMTLDRFKQWTTKSEITVSYLVKRKTQIVGFVNLMRNKYKYQDNIVDVMDVVYCLGNKLVIMPLLLSMKTQYYIFLDIMDHKDIIALYQMKPLYITNYYFYNYELLNRYNCMDVGINRF